jgi:hypothetical protein
VSWPRRASSKPETDGSGGVPAREAGSRRTPSNPGLSIRSSAGPWSSVSPSCAFFLHNLLWQEAPKVSAGVSISSGPSLRSIRSESSPPSLTRIGTHCRNLAASLRPAYLAGSSRASMQVRIANRRAAARGSTFGARFNVVLIYCKFRLRFGL